MQIGQLSSLQRSFVIALLKAKSGYQHFGTFPSHPRRRFRASGQGGDGPIALLINFLVIDGT